MRKTKRILCCLLTMALLSAPLQGFAAESNSAAEDTCGDNMTWKLDTDNETAACGHSYSGGKCAVCGTEMNESEAEPSVGPRSAAIYLLEDWTEGILEIPAEYPQSYQIKVENAEKVSFRVFSGNSVRVTADGLVTPRVITYYWYGNIGYTSPKEGVECDRVTHDKYFGSSVIRVTADGKTFDITVDVCGYGEAYVDKVMEDYLAENCSEDMTIEEKMNVICRFPTQYAYDSSCFEGAKMVVTGGGNYYASAEAIAMLCEKTGFEAKVRNALNDSGTHSYYNVIVAVGPEDYYILDAGFSGEVPRDYLVTHRTSPYVYKQVEGGIEICQYDGTATGTIEIPAGIDGYRVVGLGSSLFSYNSVMKKVILPDTLQYIKGSAFEYTGLEEIHIPANVTSIGTGAFALCYSLEKLTVDENNPAYTAIDGVIYTKDETTLVSAHLSAEPLLPDTLKTVGDYAFYYNTAVTQVTLPGSVESVGKYAFSDCDNLTLVDLGNVKTIGDYAMVYCPKLTWVYVPETVETIGNKALGYRYYSTLTDGFVISGHKGTAAETYAAENGITFVDADVPQWVETTAGTRYFVDGIPVTGMNEIDGETYYFTDDGFLCVHKTTELKGKMPATCAVEGYTGDTVCKACGYVVTKGTAIEKLAHFFGTWTTTKAAACEEKGEQKRACINCDAFETRETDARGHSFGEWIVTKAPTTTESGEEMRECGLCGAEETRGIDQLINPFVDVVAGAYYEAPVLWAVDKGVTNGTDETHFKPNQLCTRAEVVTFLWRAVGSPEPTAATHPFVDVRADSYYEKAVLWAAENGITMGMDDTHFGPTLECTRAQVAMFLWRTLEEPTVTSGRNPFKDVAENHWFYTPVLWAVENGITNGLEPDLFAPDATCTRAQIVTFLYRALG